MPSHPCTWSFLLAVYCALNGLTRVTEAVCPNSCSGHGTCGEDDVCYCYQNWGSADALSGDCSQQYCPHEVTFVAAPDETGQNHRYMECAGQGICDRETGECNCFDGYSGKACQRTTCPGELEETPGVFCFGHGSCEFIDELGFGDHPGEYYDGSERGLDGLHSIGIYDSLRTHFPIRAGHLWEKQKIMQCVCDATYTGSDCSLRLCPRGNDIIHHRVNPTDAFKYYIQNVTVYGGGPYGNGTGSTLEDFYNHTFALTFTSHLNESYTTQPIKILSSSDVSEVESTLASDIAIQLMALPHNLIDEIYINVTMGYESRSYNLIGNAWDGQFASGYDDIAYIHFTAEFVGKQNMGNQKLLTFHYRQCIFCTPQLGVEGQLNVLNVLPSYGDGGSQPTNSNIRHKQDADFNNYECGRRGKCDFDTGICDCFEGFYGDACGVRNELI